MLIKETDDWNEDDGYCLFFHFENFEEPPEVKCASPLETGFDPEYWSYFSRDVDFNNAIEQAEKLHRDGMQEYTAN